MADHVEARLPAAMAWAMRSADANWARSQPRLPPGPARVERWGSLVLDQGDAHASFKHQYPRLQLTHPATSRALFRVPDAQQHEPLLGTIGAMRFEAKWPHLFGHRTMGSHPEDVTGFQLVDWSVERPDRNPAVFVGDLHGPNFVFAGANVRMVDDVHLSHIYVPSMRPDAPDIPDVGIIGAGHGGDGLRLALRWNGAPDLTRPWLSRIVEAVSFVLGVPRYVPCFVGYDPRGRRIAGRGNHFGTRRDYRSLPGQPWLDSTASWIVPFLRRLLVLLRDRPQVPELDLAIDYYLDSFDDEPDAAYLKLVVVLEGLAHHILRERGASVGVTQREGKFTVVPDGTWWKAFVTGVQKSPEHQQWKSLVAGKRDELVTALALPSHSNIDWVPAILDAMGPNRLSKADELGAGRRVFAALLAVGARPDSRMKKEADEWHKARHTGIAPGARDEVADRLTLLRSMLVLMIARWCGYAGPVTGHIRTRDHRGHFGGVPHLARDIFGEEVSEEQRVEATLRYVEGPAAAGSAKYGRRSIVASALGRGKFANASSKR